MENSQSTGYLKVRTTFGDGAFPVESAVVIITDSDGNSVASLRTDRSGLTETLSLQVPPASLSLTPGSDVLPYAIYTIQIRKDGFYDVDNYSVPVFDSVTSIQSVNLLPLSEFAPLSPNPRPQNIETPGYPLLEGKEERR